MLGEDSHGQAEMMFKKMDKNRDGKITEREFIRYAMEDPDMSRILSSSV